MKTHKSGFTLVELLVVATIISLLAAAATVSYTSLNKQSRDAKRKADLENVRLALEQYRAINNAYPVTASLESELTGAVPPYINQVPDDPVAGQDYSYTSTTGSTYTLCAALDLGGIAVAGCGACGTATCNYKLTPLGVASN